MDASESIEANATIEMTDTLAEAGRKIFAKQLEKMQKHEEGSRTGDDIESVHQMRVATRRMRSLFKLLGSNYKSKTVAQYAGRLRDIARALGRIRDLDVMILDLQEFQSQQDAESQAVMQTVIDDFDKQRRKYRKKLNNFFDSDKYLKFKRRFAKFTQKHGKDAAAIDHAETPHEVRHVLPVLLHERLAVVRAYETVMADADDETLHALRVEFKRLRYAVEFFQPVLGTSAEEFISVVKNMQDALGRMNDVSVFTERIHRVKSPTEAQQQVIEAYSQARLAELENLRSQFDDQWQVFNQRTIQRHFSDALLVLR